MAKMLEALDLSPGLRTLEIGAGTGYNAALIHHITGAAVVTVEAGHNAATEATTAVRALGLAGQVHVIHGDGYAGYPDGAPYDRSSSPAGSPASRHSGWTNSPPKP